MPKKTIKTEIAQSLDVAGDQAKYDAAARKLVAQKAILAYILKSTLDEFCSVPVKRIAEEFIEAPPRISGVAVHQDHPDVSFPEEEKLSGNDRIEGLPTEDVSVREGTVRYDIRFPVRVPGNQERMEIIVNIEIQNDDMPGYPIPKRGIYYGSRLISAQRGTIFTDQEYEKIKKVVSIWICEGSAMVRSDTINEYCFAERCRRGEYREARENYDLMTVVVMRLGPKGEGSKDDALRLLSKVFSTERSADEKKAILSEEFHIEVTEKLDQEVSSMCNLSAGVYDKGLHEGRREGKVEGALEMLFSLVKNGKISVADAAEQVSMEKIAFEKKYKNFLKVM